MTNWYTCSYVKKKLFEILRIFNDIILYPALPGTRTERAKWSPISSNMACVHRNDLDRTLNLTRLYTSQADKITRHKVQRTFISVRKLWLTPEGLNWKLTSLISSWCVNHFSRIEISSSKIDVSVTLIYILLWLFFKKNSVSAIGLNDELKIVDLTNGTTNIIPRYPYILFSNWCQWQLWPV
jgi:hypothetical protein